MQPVHSQLLTISLNNDIAQQQPLLWVTKLKLMRKF
jgi:hypothetical protein